jgi:transcriptional regulator with XRE-family HTH domain
MLQTIGKRIAQLRQENGWTQQSLAERLAISRVAVSHIEMDISIPGERTITLLAGLFKTTPHELVQATTYPAAKADRLPLVACCYTTLEYDLALLDNDLAWLREFRDMPGYLCLREKIYNKWVDRLAVWDAETVDFRERSLLAGGQKQLSRLIRRSNRN